MRESISKLDWLPWNARDKFPGRFITLKCKNLSTSCHKRLVRVGQALVLISDNNETFLWHLNSFVSTLPNETFPIPAFLQSCEFDNLGTNIFGFHTFCFSRVVFFPASETHQRLLTNFWVLWNILSYGKKTNFRGCSDALVSDMYPRIWKSTHLSLTKLGSATYALWSLLPHMPHICL